jgi:hypothetical protein
MKTEKRRRFRIYAEGAERTETGERGAKRKDNAETQSREQRAESREASGKSEK